jgi:hypothetical protein
MDSADGLLEAAEATGNPHLLAWALGAYGLAFRDADPVGALNAVRRGLVIAQDSGNRSRASALAQFLARLEAEHGDTASAFDHLTLAIRNWHNAGNTTTIRVPLAVLAALFDRLERYEPAAIVAGFVLNPMAASAVPENTTAIAHLRNVLGEATYESLARKGETMTTSAMATYAYSGWFKAGRAPTRQRCPAFRVRLGCGCAGGRSGPSAPHPGSEPCHRWPRTVAASR